MSSTATIKRVAETPLESQPRPKKLLRADGNDDARALMGRALILSHKALLASTARTMDIPVVGSDWSVGTSAHPNEIRLRARLVVPADQHGRMEELQDEVETKCPLRELYKANGVDVSVEWNVTSRLD